MQSGPPTYHCMDLQYVTRRLVQANIQMKRMFKYTTFPFFIYLTETRWDVNLSVTEFTLRPTLEN
jgi:hypothetical protein